LTGWKTRQAAIKVLCAFEVDKRLREHLEPVLEKFNEKDRAFLKEIVTGTVRYLRLLDFSVEKATNKKLNKQTCLVRNALRLIAYQFFFTGVPNYAAINETVEAVKRLSNRKVAGFVNAVSKKLVGFDYKREIEEIENKVDEGYKLLNVELSMERDQNEIFPNPTNNCVYVS
jgi:16S rRNA (cytosine967-C5)-methyltransferase